MANNVPGSLREAQDRNIEFFMGENCEWKLERRESAGFIEEIVGCPVHVFANNGFGDYLFLKQQQGEGTFDETVFEFFHEGPEISPIAEDLATLLGLEDRPPSTDAYPQAVYESGELVQLKDRVQVKVWAEFWKGWQDGTIEYVPGISKKKPQHEHGGLKWVAIRFRNGEVCPVVDPDSGTLKKLDLSREAADMENRERLAVGNYQFSS